MSSDTPQSARPKTSRLTPIRRFFKRVTDATSDGARGINHWIADLARNFPARATVLVFLFIIVVITSLLCLPIATTSGHGTSFVNALFTAVSAVCVTGLTVVDTATYWSHFGQAVIASGIFIGGLGVMTLASLLALAVSQHLGLTQRMLARDSSDSGGMGGVGRLLTGVFIISVTAELAIALVLFFRFEAAGTPPLKAIWDSFFMAISAFNNAGFVNVPGGVDGFIGDWGFLLPIIIGATVGAIGFPVITDITKNWRSPRRWTLHTKLTLSTFGILMLGSIVITGLLEWNNPNTLGALAESDRVLNSLLAGINTRSLGISLIDVNEMHGATILITNLSMFVGGGSASTAGGIKVTTLAVMFLALLAEARGLQDAEGFRRRLSFGTVRLAVSVLLMGAILVIAGTFLLLVMTDHTLDEAMFEAISAFGTVGLSTGITPTLPVPARFVLAVLMFAGRLGPMTFATALALRDRRRLIRMPEARPIVG